MARSARKRPSALARGQRRGRLVEHEDARAAHQRLRDLHALLLAERQIADEAVGIEVEMEVAADRGEALDRRAARQAAVRPGAADEEVLQHRVARHQLEMLVHHADAEIQRVGGAADRDRPPVDLDRAGIGGIGAEEHVHQAGLAGAVLAEQAEDVAGIQRQVDAGTGLHRAEALGDAAHRDEGERVPLPLAGRGRRGAGMRGSRGACCLAAPPPAPPRKGEGSVRHSETGVLSFTGTRSAPSRIACCFSLTSAITSAGSFVSQSWNGASRAPPAAMKEKLPKSCAV